MLLLLQAISQKLSILDLFIVGLGVDVFGAYLVARGLLLSPSTLKVFGTHGGIGVADVVDRVRNRVDARFGLTLLMSGFSLQLVGYLFQLDGDSAAHGRSFLVSGLLLLALTVGAAWFLWYLLRDRLFKKGLIAVATAPLKIGEDAVREGREKRIEWLARYGKAANWPALPYESDKSYVKRVFGEKVAASM
jgi:hypothetical protein